jgi:hypothetical protein
MTALVALGKALATIWALPARVAAIEREVLALGKQVDERLAEVDGVVPSSWVER